MRHLKDEPVSELLEQVIEAVDDPATVSGIILHGSWARRTNDAASDIDLLVIQPAGPIVEQARPVLNTQVEIYRGMLSALRQRLYEEQPLNNNFILNALHEGVICVDRGGWASALMKDAAARWQAGPAAMTPVEIASTRNALNRMLASARRLAERSPQSRQTAWIAETRSNQLFIQAFYLYHRARRRWTTSFPQLLDGLPVADPFLHELWREYVNAASPTERIRVASLLVEAVYDETPSRA